MSIDVELSAGVVAFLRHRAAASPGRDRDGCRTVATTRPPDLLLEEVVALVEESERIPAAWTSQSLGDAGRAAAEEMGARHPRLSGEALTALAWNYSFAWR